MYTVEGSAFGELSLMYGKPRAASVIAKTQGTLWCIGRAAFRAVIMLGKQDGDGLLEIYRSIPVFKDLSLPTLQRLCTSAVEKTFEKNSVLFTEETAADADWCFAVIITGVLRLIAKGEGKKRQLRAEFSYFSTFELGTKFSEARADGKLRMSCVPAEVCRSVLGTEGMAALRETVERSKCKGKRIEVPKSIFEVAENFRLTKQPDPARFAVEHPTALLGQFGYVAQFKDTTTQKLVSIKVSDILRFRIIFINSLTPILSVCYCTAGGGKGEERAAAHGRAHAAGAQPAGRHAQRGAPRTGRRAGGLDAHAAGSHAGREESICKTSIYSCNTVFNIVLFITFRLFCCCSQLIYKDLYACDLSVALSGGAIEAADKPHYAACISSGLRAVHEFGLLHRFINASSVYVTTSGTPKVNQLNH